MEILKNSNNYYGLVLDYKDGYEFKDTIREQHGARGKLAITEMVYMVPTESDWEQVKVPCETSGVFYHAVETDIPVVEEVVENVIDEEEVIEEPTSLENDFVFHDNDETEDDIKNDTSEDDLPF